jgi:hypothetical protein
MFIISGLATVALLRNIATSKQGPLRDTALIIAGMNISNIIYMMFRFRDKKTYTMAS